MTTYTENPTDPNTQESGESLRSIEPLKLIGTMPCSEVLDDHDSYVRMLLRFARTADVPFGRVNLSQRDEPRELWSGVTAHSVGTMCEFALGLETGQVIDFRLILEGEESSDSARRVKVGDPELPIIAHSSVPCLGPPAALGLHQELDTAHWVLPSLSFVDTGTHDVVFFSAEAVTGRIVAGGTEFGVGAAGELVYIASSIGRRP